MNDKGFKGLSVPVPDSWAGIWRFEDEWSFVCLHSYSLEQLKKMYSWECYREYQLFKKLKGMDRRGNGIGLSNETSFPRYADGTIFTDRIQKGNRYFVNLRPWFSMSDPERELSEGFTPEVYKRVLSDDFGNIVGDVKTIEVLLERMDVAFLSNVTAFSNELLKNKENDVSHAWLTPEAPRIKHPGKDSECYEGGLLPAFDGTYRNPCLLDLRSDLTKAELCRMFAGYLDLLEETGRFKFADPSESAGKNKRVTFEKELKLIGIMRLSFWFGWDAVRAFYDEGAIESLFGRKAKNAWEQTKNDVNEFAFKFKRKYGRLPASFKLPR